MAHSVYVFFPGGILVVVCDDTLNFFVKDSVSQCVFFSTTLDVNVVVINELFKSIVAQLTPVEFGLG